MEYTSGVGYVHTPPGEVAAKRSAIAAEAAKRPRGRPIGSKTKHCHLTPEQQERLKEIHRIRGRLAGLARKGEFNRSNPAPGEERVMFKILRSSRDTFQRCAIRDNKTMLMFFNDLAKALRQHPRYAHLFAGEAQTTQPTDNN